MNVLLKRFQFDPFLNFSSLARVGFFVALLWTVGCASLQPEDDSTGSSDAKLASVDKEIDPTVIEGKIQSGGNDSAVEDREVDSGLLSQSQAVDSRMDSGSIQDHDQDQKLSTGSHETALERLVWQALEDNPDARIAESRVAQSEARLAQAKSQFLPSLGLDTGYIHANAPSVFLFKSIDARNLAPGTDFNNPGLIDNFESGITARYNIFNGGRDQIQTELAGLNQEIAERGRGETRNALVAQVILSYFEVLRAKSLVAVAEQSVSTLEASTQEKMVQFQAGAVLESDVFSLKTRLAEAKANLLRSRNALRSAGTSLKLALGLPLDSTIDIDIGNGMSISGSDLGDYDRHAPLIHPSVTDLDLPSDANQTVNEALWGRPELENARARVAAAGLQLTESERAYLPRLDGAGRVYWDDDTMRYEQENWWVGVTLSWDLFDGGRRRAGRELAAAALEEMRQVDRKVMLAVEADAERAYYALEEARSQLKVAEEGALYAEKVYTIIESGYQNGSETVTRFMDVELALERARMRRVSAAYELRQAEVGVLRSVGRWTDPSQWPDWGYWSWTAPDSEL